MSSMSPEDVSQKVMTGTQDKMFLKELIKETTITNFRQNDRYYQNVM